MSVAEAKDVTNNRGRRDAACVIETRSEPYDWRLVIFREKMPHYWLEPLAKFGEQVGQDQ